MAADDENGYVYVLINPSMQGLVKIGKTKDSPENRAKQLSSETGIPTSFYVAYKKYVGSYSAIEGMAHNFLTNMGKRYNKNREFFQVSLDEAIEAVMSAASKFEIADEGGVNIAKDSTKCILRPGEELYYSSLHRYIRELAGWYQCGDEWCHYRFCRIHVR